MNNPRPTVVFIQTRSKVILFSQGIYHTADGGNRQLQVCSLEFFLGTGLRILGQMNQDEHLVFRQLMLLTQVNQDVAVLLGQGIAGADDSKRIMVVECSWVVPPSVVRGVK